MDRSAEREELRRYVRQWLDERAPFEKVREIMDAGGTDRSQWSELGELGWLGIEEGTDPEGFGFAEVAIIGEETGRGLYPSPFLGTVVMALRLIRDLNSSGFGSVVDGIVSGSQIVAVAIAEGDGVWRTDGFSTQARRVEGGWELSGEKSFVLDGSAADSFAVAATTDEGTGLFLVERSAPGVDVERLDVMDLSRPKANVRLAKAPGTPVAVGPAVESALESVLDRAVAFMAMEQVGAAQTCLDMSVAYAKERHQFGRPIGSFQAIKHMCADMLVAVENARSAAYHLASVMDENPDEVKVAAPLAKAYCSETLYRAAGDTIQIHGGIGFTWEHDAHFFFKRAKSATLLFGDPRSHRSELADTLGL